MLPHRKANRIYKKDKYKRSSNFQWDQMSTPMLLIVGFSQLDWDMNLFIYIWTFWASGMISWINHTKRSWLLQPLSLLIWHLNIIWCWIVEYCDDHLLISQLLTIYNHKSKIHNEGDNEHFYPNYHSWNHFQDVSVCFKNIRSIFHSIG